MIKIRRDLIYVSFLFWTLVYNSQQTNLVKEWFTTSHAALQRICQMWARQRWALAAGKFIQEISTQQKHFFVCIWRHLNLNSSALKICSPENEWNKSKKCIVRWAYSFRYTVECDKNLERNRKWNSYARHYCQKKRRDTDLRDPFGFKFRMVLSRRTPLQKPFEAKGFCTRLGAVLSVGHIICKSHNSLLTTMSDAHLELRRRIQQVCMEFFVTGPVHHTLVKVSTILSILPKNTLMIP